eukprot:jgi/Chlat1/4447/Chrsp29S04399
MAKWGEGDPRWVVAERADGTNINGWHWTEKNCKEWSKQRLPELVKGLRAVMDPKEGYALITGLKSLDGDVSVNTRKGNKKFAHYDITLTFSWEGQLEHSDTELASLVKGELKLSEFAYENTEDEYQFTVTVEGKGADQDRLKAAMESVRPAMLEKLAIFVEELLTL